MVCYFSSFTLTYLTFTKINIKMAWQINNSNNNARSINIFKRKHRLIAIMKSYVDTIGGGSTSFEQKKVAKVLPTQNLSAYSFFLILYFHDIVHNQLLKIAYLVYPKAYPSNVSSQRLIPNS